MFKCVMSQIWLKTFFGKTKEVLQILAIIKMMQNEILLVYGCVMYMKYMVKHTCTSIDSCKYSYGMCFLEGSMWSPFHKWGGGAVGRVQITLSPAPTNDLGSLEISLFCFAIL